MRARRHASDGSRCTAGVRAARRSRSSGVKAGPSAGACAAMTPRKCLPARHRSRPARRGRRKNSSSREQRRPACASDSRSLSLSWAFRAAEAPSIPRTELPVIRMKLTGASIRCRANDITSFESSFQPTRPMSDREVGLNARALTRRRVIESSAGTLGPAQKQVWQPWIPSRALTLSGTGALAVSIPAHTFWRLFFRQEVASS